MSATLLRLKYLKIALWIVATGITSMSCQNDEEVTPESAYRLTTVSGVEISMNGFWESGCVEANNGHILNEYLLFNNDNLEINIKGYDNLQCYGTTISNEIITIAFHKSATATVNFDGKSVVVNTIDGVATYMEGSVEDFKQIFFIDDSGDELYMHHALFENDGGQVSEAGYPIELIPIAITKK
ncbi:MAG: hypothetical protein WBN18_06915 [Flavobacteriaceae bacterium]